MHLHGAFYRVDAVGDGVVDTLYDETHRRLVVTEDMPPRTTMQIAWAPDEPGNWLFHCHLSFHVSAEARLAPPTGDHHANASVNIEEHMAGLVVGITVRPRSGDTAPPRLNPRKVAVYVVPGIAKDSTHSANISFLGPRRGREPSPADVRVPGEMLLLTRGQPTDVTVHNRLAEPTAIHWHGLELESWSDGVPGWSGEGARTAPAIAPGDSFTARLTLRRAGTFIYHTHLNDVEQLSAGLYGPLIVLEPGERWDPTRDFVFVSGWNSAFGEEVAVVNGDTTEAPLRLRAGVRYRLRFINIAPADHITFKIERDGALAEWQVMAKDGADLPAQQVVRAPATRGFSEGETFDVFFTPPAPGTYTLIAGRGKTQMPVYSRQLEVRR
jgi:FtsP/CotA-like multicopper oxidase with cupredoxin domain